MARLPLHGIRSRMSLQHVAVRFPNWQIHKIKYKTRLKQPEQGGLWFFGPLPVSVRPLGQTAMVQQP